MSKPTIGDYTLLSKAQVAKLRQHLEAMIHHTLELGCTCIRRKQGHERGCTGVQLTKAARTYVTRLNRTTRI